MIAAIAAFALTSIDHAHLVAEALSEAYLAVTVFVAGTLALIYGLERVFKRDLGQTLARHARWQVPFAALLGAFPGCGGAIVMVTQFTRGHVSFGALIATLTATMGDAMFLLLAKEPATGLAVLALGIVAGSLTGYLVDCLHGRSFMRPHKAASGPQGTGQCRQSGETDGGFMHWMWLALIGPGLLIGLLGAFQVELGTVIEALDPWRPELWIGVAGALVALVMWAQRGAMEATEPGVVPTRPSATRTRVINDTNFITAWVVFAFLAYEVFVALSGVDLAAVFALWGPLVPLAAILVGFLPGCGPQIVVTTLYLSGSLPLSAQLGNAISNDGDALFPALALAPRAAVLATLYSAVPAVLVAYCAFLLGY